MLKFKIKIIPTPKVNQCQESGRNCVIFARDRPALCIVCNAGNKKNIQRLYYDKHKDLIKSKHFEPEGTEYVLELVKLYGGQGDRWPWPGAGRGGGVTPPFNCTQSVTQFRER